MRLTALIWRLLAILLACVGLVRASESDQTVFPPSNGARIRIEAVSPVLHDHTATLLRATDDTLWIGQGDEQAWPAIGRTDPRPQAVPVRSVTSLEVWQLSKSRAHHTLVGAGAGALIGGIGSLLVSLQIKDAAYLGDVPTPVAATAIGMTAGLAVGAAVGASRPTGKWVGVELPDETGLGLARSGRSDIKRPVPALPAEPDRAAFPAPDGARVRVDAFSPVLRNHEATVMRATADTLWIRRGDGQASSWLGPIDPQLRAVPISSISGLRVWQRHGTRGHNMLLGAGAGALIGGIGLGLLVHAGDNGSNSSEGASDIGGVILGIPAGLVVGTAIGAFWRTGKWVNIELPDRITDTAGGGRLDLKPLSPTQTAEFNWAAFPPPNGARVRVFAVSPPLNGQKATVMAGTTDTLWIGEYNRQSWVVPTRSIHRMEAWRPLRSRAHNMRVGAVIGALAGGASMAVYGAIYDDGEVDGALYGAAIGASMGAAAGAAVGAIRRTGEWVATDLPEKTSSRPPRDDRIEIRVTMRHF